MAGGALKIASMDDLDLRMSEGVRPLYDAVVQFIGDEVDPITEEFYRLGEGRADRWSWASGQLELLEGAKAKARAQGLWNFFLPNAETGEGLSNLDYAYIANELGKNRLASECLNCSAPDTGNMEVLERVGTPEQKEQWLEPLLRGEIRSAYAMTEPGVMSSDAKQIATRAVRDGDEYVINGEKFYISGAGDPRCKVMITMVVTNPEADTYKQQSQILVPTNTPGVEIVGPMHVFGADDAPHGHMHIRFHDVRVPASNLLWGEGRGFEISQVRLGPGRIHHCMRSVGVAERAIELMVDRGLSREGFGKKLINLGKNMEVVSRARIEVEAMRLMVLRAAKAMDVLGNAEARVGSARSRPWSPRSAARSSTRPSRCTAPLASHSGSPSPRCTTASARSASLTVPTRFTTKWSRAPRSRPARRNAWRASPTATTVGVSASPARDPRLRR